MQVATRRRAEERRGGPAAPHNSLEASVIDLCDDTVIEADAETDVFDEVAEVRTHSEEQSNQGASAVVDHIRARLDQLGETIRRLQRVSISMEEAQSDAGEEEDRRRSIGTLSTTPFDVVATQGPLSIDETIPISDSDGDEEDEDNMDETIPFFEAEAAMPLANEGGAVGGDFLLEETIDLTSSPETSRDPGSSAAEGAVSAGGAAAAADDSFNDSTAGSVASSVNCPICLDSLKEIMKKGNFLFVHKCSLKTALNKMLLNFLYSILNPNLLFILIPINSYVFHSLLGVCWSTFYEAEVL